MLLVLSTWVTICLSATLPSSFTSIGLHESGKAKLFIAIVTFVSNGQPPTSVASTKDEQCFAAIVATANGKARLILLDYNAQLFLSINITEASKVIFSVDEKTLICIHNDHGNLLNLPPCALYIFDRKKLELTKSIILLDCNIDVIKREGALYLKIHDFELYCSLRLLIKDRNILFQFEKNRSLLTSMTGGTSITLKSSILHEYVHHERRHSHKHEWWIPVILAGF